MRAGWVRGLAAGVGLSLLFGCSGPPYPSGSVEELFPPGARPATVPADRVAGTPGFASMSADRGPPLVFVHGSPGEWQGYARYLDHPRLAEYGPRIAVDRPGFGSSTALGVTPSLAEQARIIAPLLGEGEPAIVVGHSLGGAVALQLAVDYPERVRGVLLIAASVAPDLESPRWYNELASWRAVQWVLPGMLVDSNRELYGLKGELQRLAERLDRLSAPVYVVQGLDDSLVDPRTADWLETVIESPPHRIIRVQDQGHFVIWERTDDMVDLLLALIEATASPDLRVMADTTPGSANVQDQSPRSASSAETASPSTAPN